MIFDNDAILKADRLTKLYRTTDPFKIAEELGIRVIFMNLKGIKGMYANIMRTRFIVIDSKLGEIEQRIVLAHEIGHDQLDRGSCFRAFSDNHYISHENHRREIGANYFSAQLLITDEDFFEMLENEYTYYQIANELRVFPELMALKIDSLRKQGHNLLSFDTGSKDYLKRKLDSKN